jgi:hypothetical protein
MKKENKVLLKVLVEKDQKKYISQTAKKQGVSEAEVVRVILHYYITKK